MKVLHNRIYLDMPDVKENKLLVNPKDIEEYELDQMKKLNKLTVFAVGHSISDCPISIGDQVHIDAGFYATRRAFFVEIEGSKKLVVPYSEILHIW